MKSIRKNNKGYALVMVILIVAIISIVGVAVMGLTVQTYKYSKLLSNIDYSNYGVDSGIERVADKINTPLRVSSGYTYTGYRQFSDMIKNKVQVVFAGNTTIKYPDNVAGNLPVNPYIKDVPVGSVTIEAPSSIQVTDVEVSDFFYEKNRLYINCELNASGGMSHGLFNTRKLNAYAYRIGHCDIPREFTLNNAIYSAGDIIFNSGSVLIEGNVNAFGSCPVSANMPREYYGGIIVKNGSTAIIGGSAETRGYIRTDASSNNRIYMLKDAIAQSINAMGNGSKIFVGKNAYTFDDLEVNGANSVIGVNGSYFGVNDNIATGGSEFDDISSSIINNRAGNTSRIAINGDISVLGKNFSGGAFSNDTVQNPDGVYIKAYTSKPDLSIIDNVDEFKDEATLVGGSVRTWMRRIGFSDVDVNTPSNITGYAREDISANGTSYTMDNIKIKKIEEINRLDSFSIDNIYPLLDYRYWKSDEWADWSKYKDTANANSMPSKTKDLRSSLISLTSIFANRTYGKVPTETINNIAKGSSLVVYPYNQDPNTVSPMSAGNLFNYLLLRLKEYRNSPSPSGNFIYNDFATPYELRGRGNDYYLFVNYNKSSVTKVMEDFKGIIISAGKVEVMEGVTITGAIIAGGAGSNSKQAYEDGGQPVINNDADKVKMENGDFAGVVFVNNRPFETLETKVIFHGRKQLLDEFIRRGIYDVASLF
ncbi:MAG: hypothetical protein N2645_19115 [Clostridia bacterium]|nr:hypothetical protein [Clostridia bacterium]